MILRLGDNAGVQNAHPHRFRHTFAITFLRNGGSPLLLQELLGHEELSTVLHYVKLAEQDIDDGARHSPADHWRL
jgi:site-specific recombinase XerD